MLSRHGLQLGAVREKRTRQESNDGIVAAQHPKPNSRLHAGAEISLWVWHYRGLSVKMPQLINLRLQEAEKILARMEISIGRIEMVVTHDPDMADLVARQSPKAGTRMRPGSSANLAVYRYERKPNAQATVPRLVGMHVQKAKAALAKAGLQPGRVHFQPAPSRRYNGMVIRQIPSAGSRLPFGAKVEIWVYRFKTNP